MAITKGMNRLADSIKKKNEQLAKLEARIEPLLEKKQKLLSEIKGLEEQQAQIRYSKILGVIKGIDGIDKLTPEQIESTLARAAQSSSPL
jgi:chromosome segregation ATPase